MDTRFRWNLHWGRVWISRRVSTLSANTLEKVRLTLQARLWRNGKIWVGVIFLLLSVWIGNWAKQVSQLEAAAQWEREHLPSEQIIECLMKSRGLGLVRHLKKLHKVLRTLPSTIDDPGSIWISESVDWIAFYGSPERSPQVQIYCLQCSFLPTQWGPLGVGWTAIALALQKMDQKAILLKGPKAQIQKDPREIFY